MGGNGTSGALWWAYRTIDTAGPCNDPSKVQPATFFRSRRAGVVGLSRRRLVDDTHVLMAIAIAASATIIEILSGNGGVAWVAAIGLLYVAIQMGLSARPSPFSAPMPRLLLGVCFVSGLSLVVVDTTARPLGALYLPIVTMAAAYGSREALIVAASSVVALAAPILVLDTDVATLVQRVVAFVVTMLVLAVGTRRTVGALEAAISRARRARTRERRRARQMAGVEAIGHLLARGSSSEALEELMDLMTGRFGYQNVSIYLLQPDGNLRLGAQRGYDTPLVTFDGTTGVVGRVMRTRETAFIRDVRIDPDYRMAKEDVLSEISTPLVAGGELLGVLNVEDPRLDGLDDSDRSTMILVAERLAAAIALGREREAIAERAKLFQALAEFSRTVNASLNPSELNTVIAEAIGTVMSSDVIALIIRDTALGDFRIASMKGGDPRFVGVRIPDGEGVSGRAIAERRLIVDTHLERASFPSTIRGGEFPEVLASAAVPIMSDDAVMGALAVLRSDLSKPFTQLEQEVLPIIAGHVALAIANSELHAKMADAAIRDPLTGLFNRRFLDAALARLLAARDRLDASERRPVAAILFDLDHFGNFNKRHGHSVGDEVLRRFAAILQGRFRASDIVARFGGEEFLVFLDGASLGEAAKIADAVRLEFMATRVPLEGGGAVHATVSAGCSAVGPGVSSMESLLQVADVGLQMAKRAGRNQIVAA
jgi:diguanylate cyclase (GGDEF)-like protein